MPNRGTFRAAVNVPNNVPLPLTSFVGREEQVDTVVSLLASSRLVTLAGAPGIGKTRLAVEVALRVGDGFADGVWLVEAARVSDPDAVARAVARVLSVREQPRRPVLDTIADRLQGQQVLLLLDNCEHLIAACADLASVLLGRCPGLSILATTQEPLAIGGETVWRVPPLSVPTPATDEAATDETATTAPVPDASGSVRLFVDRARASNPSFTLTPDVARSVADICRHLDGIPLAIELAAARVEMLAPAEIARRLVERFDFLTTGSRSALPRQQTLKAALDWSHALLTVPEQTLLRRLAVFADGFTLDAAEAVCVGDGLPHEQLFDLVARLVAKSLVVPDVDARPSRFRLLETIRSYAWDRLVEAGEAAELGNRHATWGIALAEQAEVELTSGSQQEWLGRLQAEHDNFRTALDWAMADGHIEEALRLAGALAVFWRVVGNFTEGRERLAAAVALSDGAPAPLRAKALWGEGFMCTMLGDYGAATSALEQSVVLFQAVGDAKGWARSLLLIGNCVLMTTSPDASLDLLNESVVLAREADDSWCLAHALALSGSAHDAKGDANAARPMFEECIAVARHSGDAQSLAFGLNGLGYAALREGDYGTAETHLSEALDVARSLGQAYETALVLSDLAQVALVRGDYAGGRKLADEALALARETASPDAIVYPLEVLGGLAHAEGEHEAARGYFEAALTVAQQAGGTVAPAVQGLAEVAQSLGDIPSARALFGEALAGAREAGHKASIARALHGLAAMARTEGDDGRAASLHHEALELRHQSGDGPGIAQSLEALAGLDVGALRFEQAARILGWSDAQRKANGWGRSAAQQGEVDGDVALARDALGAEEYERAWAEGAALSAKEVVAYASKGRGPRRARATTGWPSLTPAERQVAQLVSEGLTNPEIAERLFISRETVKGHLANVFAKLGISARRELRSDAMKPPATTKHPDMGEVSPPPSDPSSR